MKRGAEGQTEQLVWQLVLSTQGSETVCVSCCASQEAVPPQTGAAVRRLLAAAPPADRGRVHGQRLPRELPAAERQVPEGALASVHVSGCL